MNEANQGNSNTSAMVPVKRKRGRPRKYPRPDLDHGGNVLTPRIQSVNHGENLHSPPVFGEVIRNQPCQEDSVNNVNDAMAGQMVHGVIEAAFDAGYLLAVRVGTSETTLRGVVFKPGQYIPVSADNDVAPGVQMISRNEIPLPREDYTQVHVLNPRSRDRNGTAYTTKSSNPGATEGKQVVSVVTQTTTPDITRKTTVPVVLQSANVSNGLPAACHPSRVVQAACPDPQKGKEIFDVSHPSNGRAPLNLAAHFQIQNNNFVMHSGAPCATAPCSDKPAVALIKVEAKSMKFSGKASIGDSDIPTEEDASDTYQALSVEPLQAVQPEDHSHPAAVPRPPEAFRTSRMTELLQALQENMENQVTQTEGQAAISRQKSDKFGSCGTEFGNDGSDHAVEHA